MVFVTLSSLCSFEGISSGTFDTFNIPNIDKVVHFVFYLVMTVAGFLAIQGYFTKGIGKRKTIWYMFLFSVVYGIIIEVLQYTLTVDRHGDILDVLANSAGALTGVMLIRLLILRGTALK